ncbi:histidine--tRNA ligase, partial [Bacillus stratosphericus]
MHHGEGTALQVMKHAQTLRDAGFDVLQHTGSQSLKAQMKKADAGGARFALIVAQNELSDGTVTLKDLQGTHGQTTLDAALLVSTLQQWKNA